MSPMDPEGTLVPHLLSRPFTLFGSKCKDDSEYQLVLEPFSHDGRLGVKGTGWFYETDVVVPSQSSTLSI